jgi:allantoinase
MPDLVIRGGIVVTPAGRAESDIACEDGYISAIGPQLPGAAEEIDARGALVIPGLIDVHVHFNEPGRTAWEGAATGSRGLAAGGGTLFCDMPLNSTPCTVNADELDRKRAALEASSITDFALWGGLIPGSIRDMAAMAGRGAVGFKAFMCDSGLPEYPRCDEATLFEGMSEAARLGSMVAVHAESEEMTRSLATTMARKDVASFIASRPVAAELEAIERALRGAEATGVRLHIVHISSGQGVAMAAEARARGVDVSIETCPHYLFFTDEDLERLGAVAKCAPPLRAADEQGALWRELLAGHVDIIASDHSPTEPERKLGEFGSAWGGIAGVQSTINVLLDRAHHHYGMPIERIVALVAENPARRFRIARKGALTVGYDADLALIEPEESFTLAATALHQRHAASPYIGRTFRGTVRRTIRRGETIFTDGRITARTRGHFVAASRTDA